MNRLLTGLLSTIGALTIATEVFAQTYVLRVESPAPSRFLITNTSNQRLYVKVMILNVYEVNELGRRTGRMEELAIMVNGYIDPGQTVKGDPAGIPKRTTANTELALWNDGQSPRQGGVLICFVNDFNQNVHNTPNGQKACPN